MAQTTVGDLARSRGAIVHRYVLDIGCANGRNFLLFPGKKLWGIDIVPRSNITWAAFFKTLTYENISVERFTDRLLNTKTDLSKTLVVSHCSLMYVSKKNQQRFIDACQQSGCKNFLFREYGPHSVKHMFDHFVPPPTFVEKQKQGDDASLYYLIAP
jgi:hypothetical protein